MFKCIEGQLKISANSKFIKKTYNILIATHTLLHEATAVGNYYQTHKHFVCDWYVTQHKPLWRYFILNI